MTCGANNLQNRCAKPWQMMVIDLTGEVYPCPYFHMSEGGIAIGNTNTSTVRDTWNGPGFQDLRRRHAEGDLDGHPCKTCTAWKILGGQFPSFEWGGGFRLESGHCHVADIPEQFWERVRDKVSDVVLLEDGVPLPIRCDVHDEIRTLGGGRYSIWHGVVYASASDNSNPATNSRRYELACEGDRIAIHTLTEGSAASQNAHTAFSEYEAGSTVLQATPQKLSFIETSDCNIDCPACSQNEVRLLRVSHRPETSPAVMELSRAAHEFIWHGGEPYMIPHFRKFVSDYDPEDTPDLSFGFMSNGTMITAEQLRRLERFNRFNVTVSIDSFVPETYAKMRAGANYGVVMQNLHRLLAVQDFPRRKVTVAMIVGKPNIKELPHNLRYAMQHHIRMMINPILFYPPTDRLNIFTDFAADTVGWREALDEAEALLDQAHRERKRFLNGLDAASLVRVLRDVFEQQARLHEDTVPIQFEIDDPHGSLAKMRRPGVVLFPESARSANDAFAYAEIAAGASSVRIRAPRAAMTGRVAYVLHADLLEQRSTHQAPDWVIPVEELADGSSIIRRLAIPAYEAPLRPQNVLYFKRDMRDDLRMEDSVALMRAYDVLQEKERAAGFGFVAPAPEPEAAFEDAVVAAACEEHPAHPVGDRHSWRGFLVNYFRPFHPDIFARRRSKASSRERRL